MTAISVGVIGAAAVPHAPQMLSLPKSEDAAQVARVRAAMAQIGERFRALRPDLVIVISNDHGDDFTLRSVPAFQIHCGGRAAGRDEHHGWWKVDGAAGYRLVESLQDEGFDPAFTLDAPLGTFFTVPVEFFGYSRETAFLPIFVNAYVPPQPRPERCFAFGQALARSLERLGRRAVIIASGGLSHYPGTARYADPGPDLVTDKEIFDRWRQGNLRSLLTYGNRDLDRSGNVEALSMLMLAGALGDQRPDTALFEPNWHHTYAVFGWFEKAEPVSEALYYAATPPDRVELSRAVHALRTGAAACLAFLRDPRDFAKRFALEESEEQALIRLDQVELRDVFHIHPLLVAGAARQIEIQRRKQVEPAKDRG